MSARPARSTVRFLPAIVVATLALAGCSGHPADRADFEPDETAPGPTSSAVAPAGYELTVIVRGESVDGPILVGADVYAVPAGLLPIAAKDLPAPAFTDTLGRARFTFPAPTEVVLQVLGPGTGGGGWTREAARVFVDRQVGLVAREGDAQDTLATVAGQTVTIPLLRSSLRFELNATWQTTVALPEGALRSAYLTRLVAGDLTVSWENGAMGVGDLFAGWSWDGENAWLAGEDTTQAPTPGNARETWTGAFPVEGRPVDLAAASLRAAALTHRAVVGDLQVHFEGVLRFEGQVPDGVPAPECLRSSVCGLPDRPL